MSQQTFDNQGSVDRTTSDAGPLVNRRSAALAAVVAGVVLLINFLLVLSAAADKSWGAIGIVILIGPITNCVLFIVSLAFTPLVRRYTGGPLALHILASLLPLAAIAVDWILILSMDLHGC